MAKARKGRSLNGIDVKKANKTRNKLAKRGKLKKKDRQLVGAWHRQESEKRRCVEAERMHVDLEKQRRRRESDDEEEIEEEALPLDMVDSDDEWAKVDVDFEPATKRSRGTNSSIDYEEQPRSFGRIEHGHVKHLLPIKKVDGRIVAQTVLVKDENENGETCSAAEDNGEKSESNEENGDLEDPPSTAELYARREKLLGEYKQRISSLCYSIIENPEEKVHKLKELVALASGESEPLVIRYTVQKLATASLLEVFLDIIPGYRIRLLTEEEKHQQMKKDTRQLATYEEALLRNYKKYLQLLEKLCGRLPKRGFDITAAIEHRKEILGKLAVHYLAKLLITHPHFNFRSNIIIVLTPLMSHWNEQVRETAGTAMEQLFRSDKVGEATLDAVKAICRHIKTNPKTAHARMLMTLLHLRIKEIEKKDEAGKSKKDRILERKRKLLSMSRKEKKMQKRLKVLENELREVELEQNMNSILKLHTNIMNEVFATYFRILRYSPTSKLLPAVLAGLSKFSHLINVEFVDEVVTSLRQLIDSETLKPLEKLHCIRTVFVILLGEGQALTVDPYRFYVCLYSLLPKVMQETSRENQLKQFSICFECLDLMINRRRKQVSLSRVAAFAKRLCQLCLIMAEPECAGSLVTIRSFFIAHPQLECLMDDEERIAGAYRVELDDPEHCNALGTTLLKELDMLVKHPSDMVKRLALHLRHKFPSQGRHRLSPDLVTAVPAELVFKLASAVGDVGVASVGSKNVVKQRLKALDKEMEGLTAETCSFDGSRQTNYVRLLSLADGDSLTQPAFGNLTFTAVPNPPAIVITPDNGDTATGVPVYQVPSVPQNPQYLLAYDLGDGRIAITGSITTTRLTPVDLIPETTSNASEYADVNTSRDESCDLVPEQQHRPPEPSFDTEAQLEAPVPTRDDIVSIIPAPESPALPAVQRPVRVSKRKRKSDLVPKGVVNNSQPVGDSTRKGGWPKGKKRIKTHPRLQEPAAPSTAYVIYSRERRPLLRIENPDYSNADLTRIIGNDWTTMSKLEKQRYFQKAAHDMERYKKEISEYQQSPEYQTFQREKQDQGRQMDNRVANSASEPSTDQIAAQTPTSSASSALYCVDCDMYFINAHNKSEHMRSRKHRRNTVGEFERYLSKTQAAMSDSDQEATLRSADFLPDPVDVEDFLLGYMDRHYERNVELAALRQRVADLNLKYGDTAAELEEVTARHETLKREITQNKLRRVIHEQQLANLRAIPLLFDTELGLFPM